MLAAAAKGGLKTLRGSNWVGRTAVAEGVRVTTASQLGANPTRVPQGLAETTQTIRLPRHDLYAGRGKPASPYRVTDNDDPALLPPLATLLGPS
jgi:hypothetical protein